jgi:tetratricopeptide (TPR) repeat protein
VEKEQFLSLIKNYTLLGSNELTGLVNVQNSYPYCQTIHHLATRAASDNNSSLQENLLHLSAIYATDRAVLKLIMSAPKASGSIETIISTSKDEHESHESQSASIIPESAQNHTAFSIDDLFADLEKLRKSKLFYESSMEVLDKENQVINKLKLNDPELEIKTLTDEDALVSEISINKKEILTADHKQKEQIEIIENFIRTQPGLSKPRLDEDGAGSDLSDKNQHFADNVISETLVEILLKQGKKAKAIEVLKKLIWKFPQKKAYFAAQIEDLRK